MRDRVKFTLWTTTQIGEALIYVSDGKNPLAMEDLVENMRLEHWGISGIPRER